jgi:peroxidase
VQERNLQSAGFIMGPEDIGYSPPKPSSSSTRNSLLSFWFSNDREVRILTETAKLMADRNELDLNAFESFSSCLRRSETVLTSHPKYRSIDGYGNNLKHPHWGTTGRPFGRFMTKNYGDKIYSIRKSVTGSELPSPREISRNVLFKAKRGSPPKIPMTMLTILIILYVTHDLAHQIPIQAINPSYDIRCCSKGNDFVLPQSLSHPACLPISVGSDDEFYSKGNISCLNMIRSQTGSLPSTIQAGEIKNHATGFIDHSIVYGTKKSQSDSIRTFSKGQLRMSPGNVLPVDRSGEYSDGSGRLTVAPIGSVWPALFSRNHNYLALELSSLNPQWNDETLFQESRRINIAILQSTIYHTQTLEILAGKRVNETYNENTNPATSVEFNTAAYRFGHHYIQSDMLLVDAAGNIKEKIKTSDSLGKINLAEENFEDVLRGVMNQPLNYGPFVDELLKIQKNENGFGIDLPAVDIQRGKGKRGKKLTITPPPNSR